MLAIGSSITGSASMPLPPVGGSTGQTTPGILRPGFGAIAQPAFLYHPQTETVLKSGGDVVSVTGQLSPDLTSGGTGPREITDGLGRKCWRFEGSEWLDLPLSFTSTPRALTVFVVGRQHKRSNNTHYFSQSYEADGVTVANTLGSFLNTYGSSGRAPFLRSSNRTTANLPGREWMALGSQLSAFGISSRSTANGGCRFYVNEHIVDAAQSPSTLIDCSGGRIGGYLRSNGSTNGFDLYCIVAFNGELNNSDADAISDLLIDHYEIAPVARQIVLEGDSIIDGIDEVTSGRNLSMALTEPGSGLLPSDCRVINMGISGARVENLITRRDAAQGWPETILPGGSDRNILAGQIGRNDYAGGGKSETQIRDDIVSYLSSAGPGVFARGFDVRWAINIANGNMSVLGPLRDLLRNPTFLTLNNADSGSANAGRLALIDLPLIESPAGIRRFDLPSHTGDEEYYQIGDTTYPNITGTALMASGGATPQHGYGGIL